MSSQSIISSITSAYTQIYICKFSAHLTTHCCFRKCRICFSVCLRCGCCLDLYRSFRDLDRCTSECICITFQVCLEFYGCFSTLCSCRALIQCIVAICIFILDGRSFNTCCRCHSMSLSIICFLYICRTYL